MHARLDPVHDLELDGSLIESLESLVENKYRYAPGTRRSDPVSSYSPLYAASDWGSVILATRLTFYG